NGNISKKIIRKKSSLKNISESKGNLVITGEPGSGKTKLLNNIALLLLDAEKNANEKILPIKLNGRILKENNFNFEKTIRHLVELNAPESFNKDQLDNDQKILLIDEI